MAELQNLTAHDLRLEIAGSVCPECEGEKFLKCPGPGDITGRPPHACPSCRDSDGKPSGWSLQGVRVACPWPCANGRISDAGRSDREDDRCDGRSWTPLPEADLQGWMDALSNRYEITRVRIDGKLQWAVTCYTSEYGYWHDVDFFTAIVLCKRAQEVEDGTDD